MTDYKATPEQWAQCEVWGAYDEHPMGCILELRARVEALEARRPASKTYKINEPLKLTQKQQEEIAALLRPNHPAKPDSSLVERVQRAIHDVEFPHGNDEARAAIREVAAWLQEHYGGPTASSTALEQQVER